MAVDTFLALSGVRGESLDRWHPGEIDILSWSWGVVREGAAVPTMQSLQVTKHTDLTSTRLLTACHTGQVFDEARLTARHAGERPLDFLRLTMRGVRIESLQASGSAGGDGPIEAVSLIFQSVQVEHVAQTASGEPGEHTKTEWLLAAGRRGARPALKPS
jgi:type VI secretion system secreted protein Hcp